MSPSALHGCAPSSKQKTEEFESPHSRGSPIPKLMNIDARSAGPPSTMPQTIRLVEAKLVPSNRPQATPRKSKIKYAAAAALLRSEGLWSLGTILLGNRVFMDRSAGVFPWHALSRCPGRLFPQEACSNASWQKSLISEPSGLVQADLPRDRVMIQCRRSRSAAAVLSTLIPE